MHHVTENGKCNIDVGVKDKFSINLDFDSDKIDYYDDDD